MYRIRPSSRNDIDTIVAFTLREALEAEGVELDEDEVRRGVQSGLEDDRVANYWVAETVEGLLVAATSVVTEWSNFRGGHFWWIQSLYIDPEHRGRGLVEDLLDHLAKTAREAGAIDLRLYVHEGNHRAIHAYRRCGFTVAPYNIMVRSPHRGAPS